MITNSQFKAITADYEKIQNKNRHILLQRKKEIYARIPAYQELEQQISGLCIMQGRKLLSGDKQALYDMKRQLHALSAQKQQLLKEHGYPADYLEPVYDCPDCQDTGYLPDHSKCHCMKQKIAHYLYEQSGLENLLETENFSHLSTDYYQGEDLTRFKKTVQNARKFVSDFSSHYRNLLFYGTVGTGKSFLSCCIAKELLDAGYCVLYFSACSLFDRISEYTFGSKDRENLAQLYQDLYACDLLIIDDLGTEMTTQFTVSALYQIVNGRLLSGKPTIVSTNLPDTELEARYSAQIASRLLGAYTLYQFCGTDVRLLRKMESRG